MCLTMTVSLLRHNSNYGRCSQGKQRLKSCVFRRLRKTDSDGADVACCGRLFRTRAAATGSQVSAAEPFRSPIVYNCVWRTIWQCVCLQALTKLRAEHNSGPASAADLPEHRLIEEHWIRYRTATPSSFCIVVVVTWSVRNIVPLRHSRLAGRSGMADQEADLVGWKTKGRGLKVADMECKTVADLGWRIKGGGPRGRPRRVEDPGSWT